ncbi:hypothetical protein V2H45_12460 [Tumidithrix elongata RA019]|uniref:Phage tail assembly protein n=1 Tax=Tumidithrix elongata BACA0141 TaxID=2716417 RepID=A0AAW9Q440_9CYAN|nr:hypothetical protein [Tumidithrix elongata RA019]
MPQQEVKFTLPKGLLDPQGNLHRQGSMRLAIGKDELVLQSDRRVVADPAYGVFVMLSQVITQLGELTQVTPELLEQTFLIDFLYLKQLFGNLHPQSIGVSPLGEL